MCCKKSLKIAFKCPCLWVSKDPSRADVLVRSRLSRNACAKVDRTDIGVNWLMVPPSMCAFAGAGAATVHQVV